MNSTRQDVKRQNGDQLVLVLRLDQILDGTGRELGKGVVRGSEHGEGACALQGIDQVCSRDGSDQCVERPGGDGGIDDVVGFGCHGCVVLGWRTP
jgi:hypothetical protein